MTTPTLSMQIFGQMQREEGIKRRRSEAAKKAWKTRRRMVKISPLMKKVMEYLHKYPDTRLVVRYLGKLRCRVGLRGTYAINPLRGVTYHTFRAMEKRGWLEFSERVDDGGIMGTLPNGKRGIVEPSFGLRYRLSEKGIKALSKEKKQ